MRFAEKDILEFVAIWEQEFGERLDPDEAQIQASRFMELCRLLVQPLPNEPGYQGAPLITL